MTIGKKKFYKGEPVLYFDTLKTSSLEGASTTVYAQGGRGNSRLIAWDGEKTLTFTMEDALISPESFMLLASASSVATVAPVHATERVAKENVTVAGSKVTITLGDTPSTNGDAKIYVMIVDGDEIKSEPYIAKAGTGKTIVIEAEEGVYTPDITKFGTGVAVLVDYYVDKSNDAVTQIEITPDMIAGNFYLEASTLFRNTDGVDMPAEFIIPNCKVQSNFTLTMAATGDPSTFTFTMDAFPDYTTFDETKKVLCVLQVVDESEAAGDTTRSATAHDYTA